MSVEKTLTPAEKTLVKQTSTTSGANTNASKEDADINNKIKKGKGNPKEKNHKEYLTQHSHE